MDILNTIMNKKQIDEWGICRFDAVLPLLPTRRWQEIADWAKTVIVMLFGYYIGAYTDRNISRYAIVDDYHTIIRQELAGIVNALQKKYNHNQFIPFVDNGPIPETRAAYLAGLGGIGRNGQLLSPVYGSYCFIAEIVTDLELPVSTPLQESVCTGCGACIKACPTGALSGGGFQIERCRSHITQKKGSLSAWERSQIHQGQFVWGCDLCTDACPVNQKVKKAQLPGFYQDIQPVLTHDSIERLSRTKAYGWRGQQVLRRNLEIVSNPDADVV